MSAAAWVTVLALAAAETALVLAGWLFHQPSLLGLRFIQSTVRLVFTQTQALSWVMLTEMAALFVLTGQYSPATQLISDHHSAATARRLFRPHTVTLLKRLLFKTPQRSSSQFHLFTAHALKPSSFNRKRLSMSQFQLSMKLIKTHLLCKTPQLNSSQSPQCSRQ